MIEATSTENEEPAEEIAAPPPKPPAEWADLGLSAEMLQAVQGRGYTHPTPVQAESIPFALEGRDVICRAKTGTGKTAAFMIPTIERIPAGYGKAACIVLSPTRELAIQIAEEAELLAKPKGLRVISIYGGVAMGPQEKALKDGYELVIGTPGRVADHIRRGNLKLGEGMVGVLDEADEMLSMGFFQEVTNILSELPKTAQIQLFSATVEERLKQLIGKFLKDPHEIYLSLDTDQVAGTIDHVLYETSIAYPKPRQLMHVLEVEKPRSAIIFCNTRSDTEVVSRFLNKQGLVTEPISSDLSQKARERVMKRIKAGEIDFLCATDIAARGIDISELSHVINYSLPEDPAVYLHRTGRTGRIGNKGTAVSFFGGRELACMKTLTNKYEIKFERRDLPSQAEAEELWSQRHVKELKQAADDGVAFEGFLALAKKLKDDPRGEMSIAIALSGFFRWHRMRQRRNALLEAGEDPDAVEALMQERSRKSGPPPRRGGGGGRGRGDRDRGGRGDRDRGGRGDRDHGGRGDRDRGGQDRGQGGRPPRSASSETDKPRAEPQRQRSEGDAPRKRRRRRGRGKGGGGEASAPASSEG